MDPGCVFCRIAAGEAPASLVCADPDVLAFCDLAPANPGHLLVAPRRHASGLGDLEERTGELVFRTAHRLARALRRSGLRCEGVTLFLADGAAAGQDVFHAHLHVIPRWRGDRFRLGARRGATDRAELDRVAASVARGLVALEN